MLEDWLEQTPPAEDREGIEAGRPYVADGTIWFRSKDALNYLSRQHRMKLEPHALWAILRNNGGSQREVIRVGDKIFRMWALHPPIKETLKGAL